MPRHDEKIFDKALWYKEEQSSTPHAYLMCSRYRVRFHLHFIQEFPSTKNDVFTLPLKHSTGVTQSSKLGKMAP